jgi:Barstar, RNAse (barnase) inhibitor
MPIKRCVLNGLKIHSLDDLYAQLEKRLSLPAYFGRNLDALWDVLSADVEGPFKIVWKHGDASKKFMGRDFNRAVKLLRDLEKERHDFQLTVEL